MVQSGGIKRQFSFGSKVAPGRGMGGTTRRGFLLLGGQLLVASGLALRLRQLQVEEAERYRLLAEENRINLRLIAPARAQIYDREGKPLAINKQNFRVVMIREQAGDPEEVLDRLGRILELSPNNRERALTEMHQRSGFVPVLVAERLTWDEFSATNVNAPALAGIQPEVGLSRFYPSGFETAHIVGYVSRVSEQDLKNSEDQDPILQIPEFQLGKRGVEAGEDKQLRGTVGTKRIEVNALGRVIRELDRQEGAPGKDLHLTIDAELQKFILERIGDESAAVVAMDVQTGDLHGLISAPSFDPNLFVRGISHEEFKVLRENERRPLVNKWATGMYPPGSTFKMAVALAALKAGVISPEETVYCNGSYTVGRRRFHCWKRGGHGKIALVQGLAQSCDVYFYETARRVGIDNIAEMSRQLSLGGHYDFPVPGLKKGLIPTKAWKQKIYNQPWTVGDTVNSGIGQGYVLTTPLQLAVMTARIATGRAVTPRLIRARSGLPVAVPEAADLGISEYDLNLVREGMFEVVNGARGTARRSRIADELMAMAGKTGTSQVRNITKAERAAGVIRNEDLPWRRRDHAIFVSYAPFENPRYAVAVVVEHGGGGSTAAAPIARDVMMHLLYGPTPPLSAYPPGQKPDRPAPEPAPRPQRDEPVRIRT